MWISEREWRRAEQARAAALAGEVTLAGDPAGVYLDGERISPTVYNIKGNNYIGLRALGELVDFGVSYNYDNKRITAYAAYPYAEETTWTAAMNDLANNLRLLPASAYSSTAAKYAPVVTGETSAGWRALVSVSFSRARVMAT